MLRHEKNGIGHPYRTEPFEKTPRFPTHEDIVILRVMASTDHRLVFVDIDNGSEVVRYPMQRVGAAVAVDESPFGQTAKEILSQTHLQDAAERSGEYSDFDYWVFRYKSEQSQPHVNYRFIAGEECSEYFPLTYYRWVSNSNFKVLTNDENKIANVFTLSSFDDQISRVRFEIKIDSSEKIIGFGERFNTVVQEEQNVDAVVYEEYKGQGSRTYLPVPFFHAVTSGFGVSIETSTPSRYQVMQSQRKVVVEVDIVSGQKELLVSFYSGTPTEVLNQYLDKAGKPKSVPDWAYSLWISSNEWNTQARVGKEISRCISSGIKPGVVVIEAWSDESTFTVFRGAEYTPTSGNRGLTAADIRYAQDGPWPDPKGMIEEIHRLGARLLLWQIPVIKEPGEEGSQARTNWNFAIENNRVVLEPDGNPYRVRGFWFQNGLLPDLTSKEVRDWWTEQRRYLVEEYGVDGFKTDGGEHAWGSDLQYLDGKSGLEKNNTFPVHYAQAFHELMERCGREGITFSRAGFTGSQRYPTFWAGDENSTWTAFRASIRAGITASASGFFHWGWDIGGFSGDIPSPELYLRSAAVAVFCPIMQIHSEFNHHQIPSNDRTPWNLADRWKDPSILRTFTRLSDLRQDLIPYLSHCGEQARDTGRPIMAGLFFDYWNDENIWRYPFQYMLGTDLLVAPITDEGVRQFEVYLPDGDWFDFWTGDEFRGGQTISIEAPLDKLPVFSKDRPFNFDKYRHKFQA